MIVTSGGRHPLLTFLCWQGIGLALLFCQIAIAVVLRDMVVAYALTVSLALLLYVADSLAGFAVFLQFLMYQNVAISLASNSLDFALYHGLQGTSFALMAGISLVAAFRLWGDERNRRTLVLLAAAGAIILVYTAIGAMRSSFGSAAVYFRSSSVAMLGLLIGWDLGRAHGYREIGRCFLISMALGLILAFWEAAAPLAYYHWIDAKDYYQLQYNSGTSAPTIDFRSAEDVVSYLTHSFFNLGGLDFDSVRFGGPNMHSVSYAYVLSIGALVAMSLRAHWFAAALLPLIFLIGVKGAAVTLLFTAGLWIVGRTFGGIALGVLGAILAAAYVSLVIWYGLSVGDYHTIGLIAGIEGFLRNPLGYGIGVGGNLSSGITSTNLTADWREFQLYGSDQPLESAIGVLVYQMGVGAVAVLCAIWLPFKATIKEFRRPVGLIPLAIAVVCLNGFFQEEAFSPYSLALLTLFAGVLLSRCGEVAPVTVRELAYPLAV